MHQSVVFEWKSAVEPTYIGRGELTLGTPPNHTVRASFATVSKAPLLYSDDRLYQFAVHGAADRLTLSTTLSDTPQMIYTLVRGPGVIKGWYACIRPMDCGTITFSDPEAALKMFTDILDKLPK